MSRLKWFGFLVSLQNENEHVVLLGSHNVCGTMKLKLQSDILSLWEAVRICILCALFCAATMNTKCFAESHSPLYDMEI